MKKSDLWLAALNLRLQCQAVQLPGKTVESAFYRSVQLFAFQLHAYTAEERRIGFQTQGDFLSAEFFQFLFQCFCLCFCQGNGTGCGCLGDPVVLVITPEVFIAAAAEFPEKIFLTEKLYKIDQISFRLLSESGFDEIDPLVPRNGRF